MLSVEVIGVLVFLYIFLMVGTAKAILAKRAVRRRVKTMPKPVVKDGVPETAKQTV
jgi:hypothetical protein